MSDRLRELLFSLRDASLSIRSGLSQPRVNANTFLSETRFDVGPILLQLRFKPCTLLRQSQLATGSTPNRRSYIRLAVIRSLLMGSARSVVAQQFCRTDRVVRLWIEMFNVGGIDALTTKGRPGRGRRVKLERLRDLLVPVLENPRQAGELHWTGVKIHGFLKEQLGLEVGYSTTVRYLHELGYNLRVPRPWPERQNEEHRNAFLDQFRHRSRQ